MESRFGEGSLYCALPMTNMPVVSLPQELSLASQVAKQLGGVEADSFRF